jgi:6-phosphogluconolactonase (cycloisomerase 2 family)
VITMRFYVKKDSSDSNLYSISKDVEGYVASFESEEDSATLAEEAAHALVLSGEDMNKPYTIVNPTLL